MLFILRWIIIAFWQRCAVWPRWRWIWAWKAEAPPSPRPPLSLEIGDQSWTPEVAEAAFRRRRWPRLCLAPAASRRNNAGCAGKRHAPLSTDSRSRLPRTGSETDREGCSEPPPARTTSTAEQNHRTAVYTSSGGLGSLATWHLPGGPVGPPARWAATSNVEVGQST